MFIKNENDYRFIHVGSIEDIIHIFFMYLPIYHYVHSSFYNWIFKGIRYWENISCFTCEHPGLNTCTCGSQVNTANKIVPNWNITVFRYLYLTYIHNTLTSQQHNILLSLVGPKNKFTIILAIFSILNVIYIFKILQYIM